MQNYSRSAKILAIVMIVLGAIRTVQVLPELSTYGQLKILGNSVYLSAIFGDTLASIGMLVVGILCLLLILQRKALMAGGILAIVVGVATLVAFLSFMFATNISVRSRGTVIICALPVMVGISMIQMHRQGDV